MASETFSRLDEKSSNWTILHVAPTPFFSDRGCHMRIRGIIQALQTRNVECILCTYPHGRDVGGIETIRIPAIKGYTKLEAGPSAFKYVADLLLLFKVCALLYRRRPDIIHGHLHEGAFIGWVAKTIFFWRRIPLVFDAQGSLVGELEAHDYFKRFRFLRRVFWCIEYLIVRMPTFLICSSSNCLDIFQADFDVKSERLILVNDGADVKPSTKEAAQRAKAELGLRDDVPIVVYAGALLEAKGLDNLTKIMMHVKQRQINCHFLVVGYPVEELKIFCASNNLTDLCTLTGQVPYDDLGNYLGAADIAIDPKSSDSGEASGKLLNYMAAGLPVICFESESNRQILGDAGYYVTKQSIDGFADHIEAHVRDSDKGREKGLIGIERTRQNFSWQASGDKILQVYQFCLDKSSIDTFSKSEN